MTACHVLHPKSIFAVKLLFNLNEKTAMQGNVSFYKRKDVWWPILGELYLDTAIFLHTESRRQLAHGFLK